MIIRRVINFPENRTCFCISFKNIFSGPILHPNLALGSVYLYSAINPNEYGSKLWVHQFLKYFLHKAGLLKNTSFSERDALQFRKRLFSNSVFFTKAGRVDIWIEATLISSERRPHELYTLQRKLGSIFGFKMPATMRGK